MSAIRNIEKGSQIIDQIFWELFKLLKSGEKLTELDVAKQIKKLAKKMGAEGVAFPPIVSFGSSSAEIHHSPSHKVIGKNNFLMLDYGVKVNGYCSDFTRTLFLGHPNKFQTKIYQIVLDAQTKALAKVKVGAKCRYIDSTARNTITKAGFGKYFIHSTGHGVGRKIHEAPKFSTKSNEVLHGNLIMTVEPGIYLPKKFGVRIEDMIYVSDKPRILSKVPKKFSDMVI